MSNNPNNDSNDTGKKRKAADALGRISTSARGGRGSVVGWTTCPLCHDPMDSNDSNDSNNNNKNNEKKNNTKRFALGRGIAAHLHAVHTPWKEPGKAQKRKQRRLAERRARRRGLATTHPLEHEEQQELEGKSWEPSQAERQAWDARVLELVQQVEREAAKQSITNPTTNTTTTTTTFKTTGTPMEGERSNFITRNGQIATSYRASLPSFVKAAADGKLEVIRELLEKCNTHRDRIDLLQIRDRHGSTAEHWAAGEGQLECLKFLIDERKALNSTKKSLDTTPKEGNNGDVESCSSHSTPFQRPKKIRRRDGKTPLHYAARHGRLACVKFLLSQSDVDVNASSGDGTTPLHMACYGAQYDMVKYLCNEAGANVHAANAWGCTAAHWLSMCKKKDVADAIRELCDWLATRGVAFHVAQAQGHSALHKAAQHLNTPVLQWMADNLSAEEKRKAAQPDQGGHTPWEICQSVGGDADLVDWLRAEFGKSDSTTPTAQ